MNKLILALALVLAPFFSFAVESIFEDGTVSMEPPNVISEPMANCSYPVDASGVIEVKVTTFATCMDKINSGYQLMLSSFMASPQRRGQTNINIVEDLPHVSMTFDYEYGQYNPTDGFYSGSPRSHTFGGGALVLLPPQDIFTCPPANPLSYTLTYADLDENGDIAGCADPIQIGLVDDCRIESNDYLSRARVTSESVCATLPNGSICKYDSVDVGGGQQAYQLDLEGDCYDADKDLPKSDYVNDALPLPGAGENGYACLEDGGLLTCSEEKEDVTDPDTGEVQDGCGTANIAFICMSGDTDGDGLPDYLDPDIDGDGIANGDDLDADGDGKDDPIDNSSGGTGGTGGGAAPVDLSPVVSKLDEIKKSMSETDVVLIDKPTDKAKSFYESEYEDGLEGIWLDVQSDFQNTEMMTFLNTFKHVPSGSAANGNMCFNLGSMGNFGCGELGANPIIWGAIRIFILVTAGFLCRRLIFGG
jgi:hypothetical protein